MKNATYGPVAVLASLFLASCAAGTAENCDALQAGSLFQDFACKQQGGYTERTEIIRSETRQTVSETRLTSAETTRLRETAAVLAADSAALRRHLAAVDAELASLSLQLNAVHTSNDVEEAQVATLRSELADSGQQLAALNQRGSSDPGEIEEILRNIDQKQIAISRILYNMSVIE